MTQDCIICGSPGSACEYCPDKSATLRLFVEEKPELLTSEQEQCKKALYEQMNPRRRKFIDKIGYELWNPFQAPKDPLDIRTERTGRTLQRLLREFIQENGGEDKGAAWQNGARECALGIFQKDEKYQGIFEFCLWYAKLLEKAAKPLR